MRMHFTTSRLARASCIVGVLCLAGYVTLQSGFAEGLRTPVVTNAPDATKEVSAFIDEVIATFNKHDAKAVGALFTANGELVDADGNVLRTRDALIAHYETVFANAKDSKVSVTTDSVRVINDRLAMYDGIASVKQKNDQGARETRFAAVLTREGDRWQLASIRDLEEMDTGPAAILEKLSALKWLIGDWVEEGGSYRVHTSCQWSDDKLSLILKFSITGANLKEMTGTQRITWDAASQKIKSYAYDNLGGHAEALWTFNGEQWIVKSSGANSDGDVTSVTMIYRPIDKGRIDIISRDRVVGDEVMPDVAVTLVPRPPEPKP